MENNFDHLPTYYPVFCAWCTDVGRSTRVGWSTVEHSHGICPECSEAALAEARRAA